MQHIASKGVLDAATCSPYHGMAHPPDLSGSAPHPQVNVRREAKGLERLPSIMAPPPRLDLLSGLSALGSDLHGCWLLLTSSWLNLLLLAAPLGLASHLAGWGASPTFALVRALLGWFTARQCVLSWTWHALV